MPWNLRALAIGTGWGSPSNRPAEAFAAVSPGARVEFNYTSEKAAASPGNRGGVAMAAAAMAARLRRSALWMDFAGEVAYAFAHVFQREAAAYESRESQEDEGDVEGEEGEN